MMARRGFRRVFSLPETEKGVASDVANEIAFHLEMRIEALIADGMNEREARAQALREFGDAAAAQAEISDIASRRVRATRRAALHEAWGQDLRSAVRSLRHDMIFTIGVILTLALGIGVNAAMFDVSDRILFRAPPHIADPEHVVQLYYRYIDPGTQDTSRLTGYSFPDYAEIAANVKAFDRVAAFSTAVYPVGKGVQAARVNMLVATASFFAVTGVRPALGRFFTPEEDVPGSPSNVVVLSDEYWRREYGRNAEVIGRSIILANTPYTIIGVAPRGFRGVELEPIELIMPLSAYARAEGMNALATDGSTSWVSIIARRNPSVSDAVAVQQATAVYKRLNPTYGRSPGEVAILTPLKSSRVMDALDDSKDDWLQVMSLAFLAVTLIVLVIACLNLTNLLVARTVRRTREMGVRVALGVTRTRLISLMGAEAIIIAVAGGALGLFVARIVAASAFHLLLPGVETTDALSTRTIVYAVLLLTACAVILTMAPVLQIRRIDVQTALKTGIRDGGGRRARTRYALVAAQAALTVVLLVCSGLFVRSLLKLQRVDLGYDADKVLAMQWSRRGFTRTEAQWRALYDAALERVRHVAGVETADLATSVPFASSTQVSFKVPGRDSIPPLPYGGPYYAAVGPDYFRSMGTRILVGRSFHASDVATSAPVVIVDEAFANFVWPNESPLGKRVCTSPETCRTVVGVAENANRVALTIEPVPQFFAPLTQDASLSVALLVRVAQDNAATRTRVREAVQSIAPGMPFANIRSIADIIDPELQPYRLYAVLFTGLATLAMCVAVVGLYSVMSYAVTSRRHEMVVRVALGAKQADVVTLLMREAALVLGSGVLAGAGVAYFASRWTRSMLYEVKNYDPLVYLSVALLIGGAGMTAAFIPAMRARKAEAGDVLREA